VACGGGLALRIFVKRGRRGEAHKKKEGEGLLQNRGGRGDPKKRKGKGHRLSPEKEKFPNVGGRAGRRSLPGCPRRGQLPPNSREKRFEIEGRTAGFWGGGGRKKRRTLKKGVYIQIKDLSSLEKGGGGEFFGAMCRERQGGVRAGS